MADSLSNTSFKGAEKTSGKMVSTEFSKCGLLYDTKHNKQLSSELFSKPHAGAKI